jgi:hypothetical protein
MRIHFLSVFYFLLVCTLITNPLAAQHTTCGFDKKYETRYAEDADFRSEVKRFNKLVAEKKSNQLISSGIVYTIPVVVHVLHTGEAVGTGANISDAQIMSAIDNMNDAFAGVNYPNSPNAEIEFCLASLAPDCTATTGIIRLDATGVGDYENIGITAGSDPMLTDNEVDIKNLSRWPTDQYYNVWVVTEIDDNDGELNIQGYSYVPSEENNAVDGTVMLYNAFGYDPDGTQGYELKFFTPENETFKHETGHYLNLQHTFLGDNGGADCPPASTDLNGDFCADTEAHKRTGHNCPSGPISLTDPCLCPVGEINECTGDVFGPVIHNFMDYSVFTCMDRFSNDQIARMRTVMETSRASLANSYGCTDPASQLGALIAASCTGITTTPTVDTDMGIWNVSLNTIDYSSGSSYADNISYTALPDGNGGGGDGYVNSCAFTTLSNGETYTINVTTGELNPEIVTYYIDYNNDGDFDDDEEYLGFIADAANGNADYPEHLMEFTVPNTAVTDTPLRVRVISDFVNNFSAHLGDPCYSPQYGQVEDYTVQLSGCDLTLAGISILPSIAEGQTDMAWTIKVQELKNVSTTGTITVVLNKDSKISFVWDESATSIGPTTVNNSIWNFDNSNPSFFIWTTDAVISASSSTSFGMIVNYEPGNTSGSASYTASILTGSGNETNFLNNVDAETVSFFNN